MIRIRCLQPVDHGCHCGDEPHQLSVHRCTLPPRQTAIGLMDTIHDVDATDLLQVMNRFNKMAAQSNNPDDKNYIKAPDL